MNASAWRLNRFSSTKARRAICTRWYGNLTVVRRVGFYRCCPFWLSRNNEREKSRRFNSTFARPIIGRKRCNKKFRRQHTIGIYVADFYCAEEQLIVEIDGRDHFTQQGRLHDEARDRFMHLQGIRVVRFTGKQVETETELVLTQIDLALRSASQAPSIYRTVTLSNYSWHCLRPVATVSGTALQVAYAP